MSKVIYDMSMSLDGFVRASNATPEEPLGKGGEQLHEWAFAGDDRDRAVLTGWAGGAGAMICGRRTYDDSIAYWKADGPSGSRRLPLFVVTHSQPEDVPAGGVYAFVTDGIHSALEHATTAAAGRDVAVMGGPDIGRQFLAAGLIDEIGVHVVPVLFGSGVRMFDQLGEEHIKLEVVDSVQSSAATHVRYRVVKRPS